MGACYLSDLPTGFVLDKKPMPQPVSPPVESSGLPAGFVIDRSSSSPVASAQKPDEGIAERLWEGLKAGFSDRSFKGVADVPGGAVGMVGALPARMAYRTAQGIGEAVDAPYRAFTEGMPTDRRAAVERTLPTAMTMAGQGWRAPRTTIESAAATGAASGRGVAGLWEDLTTGTAGSLRDRGGGGPNPFQPIGGGNVQPAAPAAQPPVISTGMQPQRPTTGAMPEPQPGVPATPGGTAVPMRPTPVIPPGLQPVRPTGTAGIPGPTSAGTLAPGGAVRPPMAQPPVIPPGMQPPRPVGISGIPGEMKPGSPTPPGGRVDLLSAAPTSSFADAIAANDGGAINRELTNAYRAAVQPKPLGTPRGRAGLTEQNRRIVTTVDSILAAKPTLRVTDPYTKQKIPFPARPNMEQFAEGLDHVKGDIFHQYDQMARTAQDGGVRVDLSPAVAKAQEIAHGVVAEDLSPAMRSEAMRLAEAMSGRHEGYTPLQAQEMIEGINEISRGFWRGGAGGRDTTAVGALNQIAKVLRDQLDKAITTRSGAGYQALRLRYQALRSVEDDLVLALAKMANKPGGGLPYEFADLFSVHQLLHGVIDPMSLPRRVGSAVATMSAKKVVQAMRDPNRAIGRMFEARANVGNIPPRRPFSSLSMGGSGMAEDNRGPNGGRILSQSSIPLGQ